MEALIEALNTEDIPAIESLLKQGVDLNVKDDNGIYPLNYAYQRGIDVTALLLEYGADPDIIDFTGTSPLHDASSEGNVDMAELLLIYGADPISPTMRLTIRDVPSMLPHYITHLCPGT